MKSTEFMERTMTTHFKKIAFIMAMTVFVTTAAGAQTVTSSIRLAGDLHPQSEQEAGILLGRVENAAGEVCGASKFSVVEYSRAIRRSPCWQQSVSGAVAHIASPILSDLYGREAR
jgi:UrcA family protein